MTKVSWLPFAYHRIRDGQVRKRLRELDPDRQSPLTEDEYKKLPKARRDEVARLVDAISLLGLVATRRKTKRVDRAGQSIASLALHERGKDDERKYSSDSTTRSECNVAWPLFPDSIAPTESSRYDANLLSGIREARRFVFLEGYEIDRDDLVDLLIAKARAGATVAVLFDPSDATGSSPKARLLKRMRDANLPNLHVAVYDTVATNKGHEQILHVKKTFFDTPSGGIAELSGGINFNKHSLRNLDLAKRTEGEAVFDSMQHFLEHLQGALGELPFDLDALLPTREQVKAAARARAQESGLPLVTVEVGASGLRPVEAPRNYDLEKLRTRARLGQKMIIASKDLATPGVYEAIKRGIHNGSQVTVVVGAMNLAEKARFEELTPRLKGLGTQLVAENTFIVEDSYFKALCRELDRAIANKESICVAAFAVSKKEVIERLKRAHEAGCYTRVLVDDLTIDTSFINRRAIAELTAVGVPVRVIDRKAKERLAERCGTSADLLKLHAKCVLIGDTRTADGSANLSESGLLTNIEDGRITHSAVFTTTIRTHLFEPLWEEASIPESLERVCDADRVPLVPPVRVNTKIEDTTFVVFDFETTGVVPGPDERVIQMSAQVIRIKADGTPEELDKIDVYVKPGSDSLGREFEIPAQVTKVTHIDKKKLETKHALGIREAVAKLVGLIQKASKRGPTVLVGQNVPFDLRFLDFTLSRKQLGQDAGDGQTQHLRFDAPWVDTVDISERLFPSERVHNLDAQLTRLGIPLDPTLPRHDAFADVVYTAASLVAMIQAGKFKTIGELLGDDLIQFNGPTLVRDARGESRGALLDFDTRGKLSVRMKHNVTGTYSDPQRVRNVTVVGREGSLIKVHVDVVGGADLEGYVRARDVDFRSGGKVFWELRERGLKLRKPAIVSA